MKVWKVLALGALVGTALLIVMTGCVSKRVYRKDMKRFYKDGFRVGRVVGRDDVLFKLKSPDCFLQKVDELMMPQADERFAEPKETAIPGNQGRVK